MLALANIRILLVMYGEIRDVLFFYKKCFEDTQLRELASYTLTRNLLQLADRPHMHDNARLSASRNYTTSTLLTLINTQLLHKHRRKL